MPTAPGNFEVRPRCRGRTAGRRSGRLAAVSTGVSNGAEPAGDGADGAGRAGVGRWALAHEHLSQALDTKTDSWVIKNRATISEALNVVNDHVGRLEILGGSPNAEVRIDGVLRGTLPLARPLTLSTGAVAIDLSAPGHVPVQRTTIVRARQSVRESFDALAPVPARERTVATATSEPHPVSPNPAGGARDVSVTTAQTVPLATGTPTAAPMSTSTSTSTSTSLPDTQADGAGAGVSPIRSMAKWLAWGLGGTALGLGVYGLVRQNSSADSFDTNCGVDPMGNLQPLPGSSQTVQGCGDLKSQVDFHYGLELAGFVGAALFAGAGFVLWLTEPKSERRGVMAAVCTPGLTADNGPWLRCGLQF